MTHHNVLCVYREPDCSYQALVEDRRILELVGEDLYRLGFAVSYCESKNISEAELGLEWDLVLLMCQSPQTISTVRRFENCKHIMNTPNSIDNCQRQKMLLNLEVHSFLHPKWHLVEIEDYTPQDLDLGFWIKRSDMHSLSRFDVFHVTNETQFEASRKHFIENGLSEAIIQEHVAGSELVKCYAIPGSDFSCFEIPGQTVSQSLTVKLEEICSQIGEVFGLSIYGIDFLVTSRSEIYVVDVNDWPSFRNCRVQAKNAIVDHIKLLVNWK